MSAIPKLIRLLPRRRWRGLLAAGAGLLVVTGGLWVLPDVVRHVAVKRLASLVTVPVGMDDVDLNLFRARARVRNVVIGDPATGRPILHLPALDLGFSPRALLRGDFLLRYLTLHRPQFLVARTGPARLNVLEALRGGAGGGGRLTVEHLEIHDGELIFVDHTQSPPIEQALRAINVRTSRVSTLPGLRLTPTSFEVGLQIGEGALTLAGAATPLAQPAGVEFTASVRNLDATIFARYLPAEPRIDLAGSRLSGTARYVRAGGPGQAQIHRMSADAELGPAAVWPAHGKAPILTLQRLAVRDVEVDILARSGRAGELVLRTPHVRVTRDAGGAFDVLGLVSAAGASELSSPPPPRPDSDAPAMALAIHRTRVEGGTLEFVDETTTPAVTTALRDVEMTLADLSPALGARPASLEAEGRMDHAPVRISGTLRPRPFATRLTLTAHGLSPEPFQPYADTWLGVETTRRGSADVRLELAVDTRADGAIAAEMGGRFDGRNVSLGFRDERDPFFRADRFAVDLSRITILPVVSAEVDRVRVAGAALTLARDARGNLNLGRLWASAGRAQAPAGREPPAAPAETRSTRPAFAIRRLEVAGSRVELVDATLTPAFKSRLSDFTLAVGDLGGRAERATLDIRGALDDAALRLGGWVAPFETPLRLHLEGTLQGYTLSRLDPYAEHYVGYRIRRGHVTTEVDYTHRGNQFESQNEITIRQIQLGDQVDDTFRERVGISLRLALSLLENADGEIRLRLPVSGTLESRRFSLVPVIWDAVRNTLVRILAAPFRLLGSILTVGGKIGELRIHPAGFVPGSLERDAEASERLAALGELLKTRPRLNIELRGRATTQEVEALKRVRLQAELRATGVRTREEGLGRLYARAGGHSSADKSVPPDRMEQELLDRMKITDADLWELAQARARVVKESLVRQGIEATRLFVVGGEEGAVTDAPPGRVEIQVLP